ncbi:hypothetical protein M427DRAFT_42676 [Gonapodya prolifera JEL478]|uniref:Uncharacterized protein n=1 Tax=Gonapodya prolifera (strain JEL478) TaxID=1344416 RepID=A0A139AMQ6_GONPJ|nr:hypothetical protein M427DRAFT_42676 [Gonapodya prolifera JEL478]|eukprot:KXS17854.1 hypothetical protein M427DRAFT_42676 [Gonapodya prolifera JEL478]
MADSQAAPTPPLQIAPVTIVVIVACGLFVLVTVVGFAARMILWRRKRGDGDEEWRPKKWGPDGLSAVELLRQEELAQQDGNSHLDGPKRALLPPKNKHGASGANGPPNSTEDANISTPLMGDDDFPEPETQWRPWSRAPRK